MNKKFITFAATAALLAGTAGYAYAQDTGVDADVDAGVSGGNGTVELDAGADANANSNANANKGGASDATLGHVIASLQTGFDADLTMVEEAADVEIIAVSELKGEGGVNAESLDQALESNETAVADLQAELETNTVIQDQLEAEGFEVADVIAVDTAADGHIVLYVQEAA